MDRSVDSWTGDPPATRSLHPLPNPFHLRQAPFGESVITVAALSPLWIRISSFHRSGLFLGHSAHPPGRNHSKL